MADPFTTYKLIVLYMAKHATQALTNSQISEFILDREYTDYFQLQKVLSELTETELLHKRTITNSSYYELTEEGRKTLSYFEKDISQDIKNEVKEYLESRGCKVQERILTPADYYTTPQGGYAVRCQIIEKDSSTIMDLSMRLPLSVPIRLDWQSSLFPEEIRSTLDVPKRSRRHRRRSKQENVRQRQFRN